MSEWHVTPDYIVNNWTDELLNLMVEKLVERRKREIGAVESKVGRLKPTDTKVSDETLFAQLGKKIKVVKHGD